MSLALDMARGIVERDAETPDSVTSIKVGRGGLVLLANRVLELEEQMETYGMALHRIASAKERGRVDELMEAVNAVPDLLGWVSGP